MVSKAENKAEAIGGGMNRDKALELANALYDIETLNQIEKDEIKLRISQTKGHKGVDIQTRYFKDFIENYKKVLKAHADDLYKEIGSTK